MAKETVEEARLLSRNAMLDVETARRIDRGHQELRSLLWESAGTAAASGLLRWTAKDLISFLQCDVEIEQMRYQGQLAELMRDADAFTEATKTLIPESKWNQLLETFKAMRARQGSEDSDSGLFDRQPAGDDDLDDEDD